MGLSIEEIRDRIRTPHHGGTKHKAIRQQERIRFHAETNLDQYRMGAMATQFLGWVEGLIPHDKFVTFLSLFRFPVKTNELTGVIFDKLSRVFDGRNPVFSYQFRDNAQRDDWEKYRAERLDEPTVWQTDGFEHFQTGINSVLIVDVPEVQAGELPEPYFYWLSIERVIDFRIDRTKQGFSNFEWIIFEVGDDRIAVFDEERYRLFRKGKDGNVGELLVDNLHALGYCPARFFWTTPVNLREPEVKRSPLSKELAALDWYLFFAISKQCLDLYAPYPVYSGFEMDCNFHNDDSGDYCDGGFLRNKSGNYKIIPVTGAVERCPVCGNKRLSGPGSFVEVPVPQPNGPDLRNPVQILTVDRNSLDYNVEEVERMERNIIRNCVGVDNEATNDQAFNERQVEASFENRTTVLMTVKRNFENAQRFVDETVCRLRYGSGFTSATVDWGTEFYLTTASELRARYAKAKEQGASDAELDALSRKIIETEYRNDPLQLQRMMILSELEPYRHLTRSELLELNDKGLADPADLAVKLNFSAFISRFERENMNVVDFGVNIPHDTKIQRITNALRNYGTEQQNREGAGAV